MLNHPQFNLYLDLLEEWSEVFNLTSIKDRQEMEILHILDSLAVLPYITGKSLLDVGTGAGFPGMVLAIARPDLEVTLLDSVGKKTRFLQQVKARLKLSTVKIVQARVEDYHPDHKFDQVISRAFSNLKNFILCTDHLCREGGEFLAMKGKLPTDELAELPSGFCVKAIHPLEVPGLSAERQLITIVRSEA